MRKTGIPWAAADNYAALDLLPEMTAIVAGDSNHCSILVNELTHSPAVLFQMPRRSPSFQVNLAALTLLARWFEFLQAQGVWDNTRIIIVSDHGRDLQSDYPGNIPLPNGEHLQAYHPLLLVKDFADRTARPAGEPAAMVTDRHFMTNADVPLLATAGIIENPVNPFTGVPLSSRKDGGITLTTSASWAPQKHGVNTFTIGADEWLHVTTDIFKGENWRWENTTLPPPLRCCRL
jgi:hypothetical protein